MVLNQIGVPSLLLLLLFVSYSKGDCLASAESKKQNMIDDNQCQMGSNSEDIKMKTYPVLNKDIKMEMVDAVNGIMQVTFPLASQNKYNIYKLQLFVAKLTNLTDNECSNVNFWASPKDVVFYHSHRYFDIYSCEELKLFGENCTSTCSGYGVIKFRQVFSGCYNLKFNPQFNSNSFEPYRSENVVIRSKHPMRKLIEMVPKVLLMNNFKEHLAHVAINYSENVPLLVTLMSNVKLESGSQACSITGQRHSCCVYDWDIASLDCEVTNGVDKVPDCTTGENNTLNCVFHNMSSGNYCITMEPQDPIRCANDASSVWMSSTTTTCLFYYNFSFVREEYPLKPSIEQPSTDDTFYIVLGVALALVMIVAVIYLSIRYSRSRILHQHQPVLLPPCRTMSIEQPQVLLLYAQDCLPFMKLMSTFRTLLANVGNCEVFDCFDPAQDEEVALSPCEWIRYRASSPAVKVVVVASECGMAHQRALFEGVRLHYREPQRYNTLFMHGLQSLMYDDNQKEYLKNFVVRFDDRDLNYLTPYTRFILPRHLLELLQSLNSSINQISLQDSKDVQKLKDDHADFLLYKQKNIGYISTMMTRSAELV